MIKINGRECEWWEGMTIRDVLRIKKYTSPRIVVKVNGKVVSKKEWEGFTIDDGDEVRAIHMIAGG